MSTAEKAPFSRGAAAGGTGGTATKKAHDARRVITAAVKRMDVVAGILWRGGRFLAARRPAGSVHAGQWEFPGGKVEQGEEMEVALARELREELGVETGRLLFWRTVEHVYTTPPRHVRLHFFHVRDFTGEPRSREGQELRWLTAAEAERLPFLEADVPVVRALEGVYFSGDSA